MSVKKQTPKKKAAVKKSFSKRAAPKKTTTKRTAPKKSFSKKAAPKKTIIKRAAPKKSFSKKAAPKRTIIKRAAAKKSVSKTTTPERWIIRRGGTSVNQTIPPELLKTIRIRTAIRSHAQIPDRPTFTGKQLVILNPEHSTGEIQKSASAASIKLASISDFSGTDELSNYHEAMAQADGVIFDKLKVAVIDQPTMRMQSLTKEAVSSSRFLHSEPERFVYAIHAKTKGPAKKDPLPYKNNDSATWGVQAINILNSKLTGKGINLAILDTGFTMNHPDFHGRSITSKSFINGQTVDDVDGHGTHTTGIAAGGLSISENFRYGTASGANIFVGKVLNNKGSGTDGSILAGIEWALENKCHIVSMSLGGAANKDDKYSEVYESAAKQAMKNNCLIIAAAGNESDRDRLISAVDHPANCPSIMAIAAVDSNLKTAWFSCAGLNPVGGKVDLTAPGVDIVSSWKTGKYHPDSGTSMATPFVAGLAALLWEQNPKATAAEIWMKLTQLAKRLDISSVDAGSGLAFLP